MSDETVLKKRFSAKTHLPTILLGLVVAVIFLTAIFTFQVAEGERALVITMGTVGEQPAEPGWHFRWPLPIQEIVKYDVRQRSFDGNIGRLEEATTRDKKNVVIGIFVNYKIEDLKKFNSGPRTIARAEEFLGSRMRDVKLGVIGRFSFDEMINVDPEKMRLDEIRAEMLSALAPDVMELYGLKVLSVGIRTIGVPESNAEAIAATMQKERVVAATELRSSGQTVAAGIRSQADTQRKEIITNAESEAKKLMAEGDAEAAKHFAVFSEDPELAMFLRKLESMKRIMESRTTLILDTAFAPFDIFRFSVQDENAKQE